MLAQCGLGRGAVVELLFEQGVALLQLGGTARDGLFELGPVLRLLQSAGVLAGTIALGFTLCAQCPRQIAGDGQEGEADQRGDDGALPYAALPLRQRVLAW